MSGLEFFDEREHVVVRAADNAVTAHFGGIAGSQ